MVEGKGTGSPGSTHMVEEPDMESGDTKACATALAAVVALVPMAPLVPPLVIIYRPLNHRRNKQ